MRNSSEDQSAISQGMKLNQSLYLPPLEESVWSQA